MAKYFTNTFSIINLYKKPSIKSEVVTQMIYGDSFSISQKNKKWLKIKIKEDKYQKNCVINSAKKSWLVFSEKTEQRIKEYKNAKRLQDLWDKIDKEDSTRSKIIKSFNCGSYYSSPKYSRTEFRTILKLK